MAVPHLALDFRLRHERGDRVDDNGTSMAPERISMSAISSACSPVSGWETEQRVGVDAEILGVIRIQRVLGVDERRDASSLLGVGDSV